jgi:hypothetical protein
MITPRDIGLGLGGLAVAVHLFVTVPARGGAMGAADRFERTRRQRQEAARTLAGQEKRAALLARANTLLASADAGPTTAPIQQVRASVVRSLRGSRVGKVRLEVRPGGAPGASMVSLSGEAGFSDVMALLAQLGHPGSGLVLQRVGLSPAGGVVQLSYEAVALGGAAP